MVLVEQGGVCARDVCFRAYFTLNKSTKARTMRCEMRARPGLLYSQTVRDGPALEYYKMADVFMDVRPTHKPLELNADDATNGTRLIHTLTGRFFDMPYEAGLIHFREAFLVMLKDSLTNTRRE